MSSWPAMPDVPELVAKRRIGLDASPSELSRWKNNNYLGAFRSRQDCVFKLIKNHDLLDTYSKRELANKTLRNITDELFESALTVVLEGRKLHVFMAEDDYAHA